MTVYFTDDDESIGNDSATAFKRSGRLKGLVRGHIGISLACRVALDLLKDELKRNPTAVYDRAVKIASRG